MSNQTGTVKLHRVLRAPVARVYQAFTQKHALEYWLPPFGFIGKIDDMDVRVGGGYRMSFMNFSTGLLHAFTVRFIELKLNERICHTDRFEDESLSGEMRVSIELTPVSCGTELRICQQGIPALIPVESCYLGWQESLIQLAHLVEPEMSSDQSAL
ncbi:SRPBCC family protein [Vibrio proteolyticus]